jgi:hypothetical protein
LVLKEIVGLVIVDHITPLAVMGALPAAVILTPDVAEVAVIAVIAVVVSVGIETMEFVSFIQRTDIPSSLVERSLKTPRKPPSRCRDHDE